MIKFHKKIDEIVEKEIADLKIKPVCQSGCSECCRKVHISVFPEEINTIVEALNSMDFKVRKAIANKIAIIDKNHFGKKSLLFSNSDISEMQNHLHEQQKQNSYECPLLHGDKCLIYHDRPAVCRTYYSTDSELCKTLNGDIKITKAYENNTTTYIMKTDNNTVLPMSLFRNIDFKKNKFINLVKDRITRP